MSFNQNINKYWNYLEQKYPNPRYATKVKYLEFKDLKKAIDSKNENYLKKIINFISEFDKAKKIIACICSGAQLLISAKVVKGRKIAGYYSMKDDLVNAGAIYTDLPAVVDNNIITTAHYKDMGPWMKEVIKKIK